MFKLHSLVKLFFVALGLGLLIFGYHFYTNKDAIREENYANVTDLNESYRADKEIEEALKKLQEGNLEPAEVITHLNPEQVASGFLLSKEAVARMGKKSVATLGTEVHLPKVIALTYDGMPNPITAKRLLKVLEENKTRATFFVEGANAAGHKETIEDIDKRGQDLGNYTYVGLAKLDKAPAQNVVKELCKTQKVLKVTSNQSVEMFKAPRTNYSLDLLKTAKASGLGKAVKTDVFVNISGLMTETDAEAFVKSVPAGSILSIVIGRPIEVIVQKESQINETPAFDKKPTIKIQEKSNVKKTDVVEATKNLLTACKKLNVELVPVKNMRAVKLAEPAPQPGVGK